MLNITNKIQRNFGRSAKHYDQFSSMHQRIGDQLLAQVAENLSPKSLLDVGCGTGYLTVKAKHLFPQSNIVGLDFTREMLAMARLKHQGIAWILGDGNHLPFADGSFEQVISNLAYQWANDLTRSFAEARRVLNKDGRFTYALFGYKTCQELFQCLNEAKSERLNFTRLASESEIKMALLQSGFRHFKMTNELIKLEFDSMQELLIWLKSIGANHLPKEGFIGPKALSKAAHIYEEKFSYEKGVAASFEVIRINGKK